MFYSFIFPNFIFDIFLIAYPINVTGYLSKGFSMDIGKCLLHFWKGWFWPFKIIQWWSCHIVI